MIISMSIGVLVLVSAGIFAMGALAGIGMVGYAQYRGMKEGCNERCDEG